MHQSRDAAKESTFERWRLMLAHYRVNISVDHMTFNGTRLRRRIWKYDSFSRRQVYDVLGKWDDICSLSEFRRTLRDVSGRRTRYVFVEYPIKAGGSVFIAKVYFYPRWTQVLQSSLYFSEARRNAATIAYLSARDIRVPAPLAVVDLLSCGMIQYSVVFTERLEDGFVPLKTFCSTLTGESKTQNLSFFMSLGKELGRLHKAGVYTEDADKNTMVDAHSSGFSIAFLDFDNVFPWRVPNRRRTLTCHRRYLSSIPQVSAEETRAFLEGYTAAREVPDWLPELESRLTAAGLGRAP
ncbi:MAG: lipopolysaccharide kinase InaA family protein [Deferrisomatales bacterium]|nr:lipopolysaccharide kinase InaA family protein [Deferrisomatales bacterium]